MSIMDWTFVIYFCIFDDLPLNFSRYEYKGNCHFDGTKISTTDRIVALPPPQRYVKTKPGYCERDTGLLLAQSKSGSPMQIPKTESCYNTV